MQRRPIPTFYNQVRFRSRAEARWAIVFDGLEIEWRYEAEGYRLSCGWYLPDFWLPKWGVWAEVKGIPDQWDRVARLKAAELAIATGSPVLLCDELRTANDCVPVICPEVSPDDADLVVDLPASARYGSVCYEFYETPRVTYRPDARWPELIQAARNHRFYEPHSA